MQNVHFDHIKQFVKPYIDILLFVVCLFGANLLWKLTIDADEEGGGPVFWLGMNVSLPFDMMSEHICCAVNWLVSLTRDTLDYYPPDLLRYSSTGVGQRIVWGCTGIKQAFIWLVIMLFARGSWKHKLWFIPLGWLCIYLFNIFRIYVITLVVEYHNEMFGVLHNYIFKYLFYFMLFMLWVWWTEKLQKLGKQN